jgi:prepilin-type N-terminal cleavage/methylation domain-containing protein
MGPLTGMTRGTEETVSNTATSGNARGFTLIEAVVAMAILTVGLLGLAQAFYLGTRHMSTSSANLIAREKAREAVESVHTARDTRTITWAQIKNVADGGVFLDGPQDLRKKVAINLLNDDDGLVNTADDVNFPIETVRDPGPNRILNDADDIVTPLSNFKRQIQILELNPVNADLRQIVVTITYTVAKQTGTYTLRTYISAFS